MHLEKMRGVGYEFGHMDKIKSKEDREIATLSNSLGLSMDVVARARQVDTITYSLLFNYHRELLRREKISV